MAVYQFTADQIYYGEVVQNIWYVGTDAVLPSQLQALVDGFKNAYTLAGIPATCVTAWSMIGMGVRVVDTPDFPTLQYSFTGGAIGGTGAGDGLPTQTALLVSLRSQTTKPNRGRKYFAGLQEGRTTNGLFDAATLGVYNDLIQHLQIQLNVAHPGSGLLIARYDQALRQVVATNGVETWAAQASPATQRGRRIRI